MRVIATAGHVDHGKSTLVQALTGTDPDRLKEEKERGITIDLGFAHAELGEGVVASFVDVPGHERFVHTMLAGAGGIDFALLVVAADDGVMPQTREHVAILDLLGVSRGAVALAKADLADATRRAEAAAEVAALLAGTGLAGAPVFPVSAVTGAGIAALRDHLAAEEARTPDATPGGRARLTVDRVFTLRGAGTIVTGTLLSGALETGETVTLSPSGLRARLRSIHAQNRSVARGRAGQRCALNLAGERITREAISRGDMVLDAALHAPTDRIDATLRLLASETKPLAAAAPARLHVGAAEVGARVVPLAPPLAPGGSGLVQLVLDQPVAAFTGDRYILRDPSARRTLGGGRFLDPHAPPRKRRSPERRALLEAARAESPAAALRAMLALLPVSRAAFARDRALTEEELAEALAGAGAEPVGDTLLPPGGRARLAEAMAEALAAWHAEHPELQGMPRERLRLALAPRLPRPDFLDFLQAEAAAGRLALDGAFARLPGHLARLTPEDEALFARIAPALGGAARFRPPRVRDLALETGRDEGEIRRLLRLCARAGRVDEIAKDHFFLRATTAEMAGFVAALSAGSAEGWFAAAAFRDRMENGRKVAIQILDFFDRQGVTMRRGDLRRANPRGADLYATTSTSGAPGSTAPMRRASG